VVSTNIKVLYEYVTYRRYFLARSIEKDSGLHLAGSP
jgi:hypothetical protein